MRHRGVLIGALIGGGLLGTVWWVNNPPPSAREGLIEISPGTSARAIARQLKEMGCVRSARWIEVLARVTRADQKLKAGFYRIPAQKRADQLLRFLVQGRGATIRVTIPEGFAVWQIAERMQSKGVCRGEDFRAKANLWEGFLFPDTYFFDPGSSASDVLRALREKFQVEWRTVFQSALALGSVRLILGSPDPAGGDPEGTFQLANGQRWTVRQAVTMASLIERETRRPEERSQVSAVYHNRLKIRMRLECDPTVQYALGAWKNPLYKKDLEVDSPYNTYRHYGLPPGPIAGPGRESLAAALTPAPVSFLYFVSDGLGGHQFSSSYEEHQRAVLHYRRLSRRKGK